MPTQFPTDAFEERCIAMWSELFAAAKLRDTAGFAFSLMPEFVASLKGEWSTASESKRSFLQYWEFLKQHEQSAIKVRIGLSFYSHLSEASGFYEIPKNLLNILSGEEVSLAPFAALARRYDHLGNTIAPNANKILKSVLGQASQLGVLNLCELIKESFDHDVRNAYAHADYVLWADEIRMPRRNGGTPRTISCNEFSSLLFKAATFFSTLWMQVDASLESFAVPVRTVGRLNSEEAPVPMLISFDLETRKLQILMGEGI